MSDHVMLLGLLGHVEAKILQGALASAGIRSTIQLDFISTSDPPAPGHEAELWVAGEDFEAAQSVVEEARRPTDDEADRTCPSCGESAPATFGQCWSCGTALDESQSS